MPEALRLLVLVLALGAGLAAVTFAALLAHRRRAGLFRALLANIALFNLLILSGLVDTYVRLHLTDHVGKIALPLLSWLAVIKVAWLVAFAATARSLASEEPLQPFLRRALLRGVGLLAISGTLAATGRLTGRDGLVVAGISLVELAVLFGALAAAGRLLRKAAEARGLRRRGMAGFALFHLAVFVAMTAGLLWGWFFPGIRGAGLVPVQGFVMIVYNLFPLVWLRRFEPGREGNAASTLERFGITPREREIIELICAGRKNQEIADRLFISLATVKDHNQNIFRKTGVRNRVELANLFRPAGDTKLS